ncbi:hypothetical protein [Lacinutrix sp. MedPE-SW]|uniref:hypothetical protein n=1 Tax=Lacinutrix sp. MedPE-SW TaxID=1860087 RepID=UPI00091625C9|nr:hypothetical protein [Lacinutrix sp. MedPE-SW]OIQ24134.1 MAG: hypothetical protein BM549_02165 [Lacinutrix sp. MedPE-SW]
MKTIKNIFSLILLVTFVISCVQDDDLPDVNALPAPTNVSALVTVAQDNSGLVTITPLGESVASFRVAYGDNSGENSGELQPGESTQHIYSEGTYTIAISASGINGKTTTVSQEIIVSFQAPENLMVTIENDASISKQVNVTASADFAMSFEVDFGEMDASPVMANIDETVSFLYQEIGTYTITVTAFSAATETAVYTEEFVVTEISQPLTAAPTPPSREDADKISMFSNAYTTDVNVSSWQSDWSTSTLTDIQIDGDDVKSYVDADFVGVEFYGADAVDATNMEFFHLDVWTNNAETFRVKLVDLGGTATEAEISFDGITQGEWVSLDIPMADFIAGGMNATNSIQQLIFSGLPTGTFDFFIDNVYFYKLPSAGGNTCASIEDFEGVAPVFTSFGNIADTQVVMNPDMSGENTTTNAAQFTKTGGSEVWAGSFFDLAAPLNLSSCTQLSIKTWSPKLAAVVRLKLENSADNSQFFEVDMNTTVTNSWEELVYDLSSAPAFNYDRIVLFFDFGVSGDDSVYYFDEINLVSQSSSGSTPLVFQDFEGSAPAFTVFGNIADTQVITNPDMSGVNTTANVAQLTKTGGSEVWAGTFFDTASPLDLNTYTKISLKSWSPKLGAVIRLKLENSANSGEFFETDMNTTVVNQWEELVFDMSAAQDFNYDRVVIFFDFGEAGDDSVYYFDEYTLTN